MTICIAALFHATYPDRSIGRVALVAADRPVSTGDIRYEPDHMRAAILGKRTLVVPSGDLAAHAEALSGAARDLIGRPDVEVGEIAAIYAGSIRKLRMRQAVQSFESYLTVLLTPLIHGGASDYAF